MNCPECRAWFEPRRRDQFYCSAKCNAKGSARELKRARAVYRALYHWRMRAPGYDTAPDWRFLCNEAASWRREDQAAQRLPPPPHDHDSDRGHLRPKKGGFATAPPPPALTGKGKRI